MAENNGELEAMASMFAKLGVAEIPRWPLSEFPNIMVCFKHLFPKLDHREHMNGDTMNWQVARLYFEASRRRLFLDREAFKEAHPDVYAQRVRERNEKREAKRRRMSKFKY